MKSNYEYLLESIKGNEESKEWLDGLLEDHRKEIEGLKDEIRSLEEEKGELISTITNLEESSELNGEIDCGVGSIKYEVFGSIDLSSIMEALEERIKKDGFKSVLRLLEYDLIQA